MVSVPLWEGVTADDTDDYYWSICRMYVYSISIFLKKIKIFYLFSNFFFPKGKRYIKLKINYEL